MSKREYDTLLALHTDSEYRKAVEELFRVATWNAEEQGKRRTRMVVVIGVVTFLIAALIILRVLWI